MPLHHLFTLFSMEDAATHDDLWRDCLFNISRFHFSRENFESISKFSTDFENDKLSIKVTYYGCRIEKDHQTLFRYPGIMEENIEDALINLAHKNCYVENGSVSVYFSLYELRKELIAAKKTYSLGELRLALKTLFEAEIRVSGRYQGQWYENLSYRALKHLSIRDGLVDSKESRSSIVFSRFTSARIISGELDNNHFKRVINMSTLAKHIYKFLLRHKEDVINQRLSLSAKALLRSSPLYVSGRNSDNTRRIKDALVELQSFEIISEWNLCGRKNDQIELIMINKDFLSAT